jgi:hypothetical protein
MTDRISESQAMHAVAASRPDPEHLDQLWDEQRSTRVLNDLTVTAQPRSKSSRRWALVAAAAALVVGVGLLAQSIIPVGDPGAPTKANALERLATVTATTPIPADSYLQETVKTVTAANGATATSDTTRWTASDGWVWDATVNSQAPYKTFEKSPASRDAADTALLPEKLPSEPSAVMQQMSDRYDALMKHSNRTPEQVRDHRAPSMLAAICGRLSDPRTPQSDRAALLRTLPLVDGLNIIENATDPANRPAIVAQVSYRWEMDSVDLVASIYFDPTNGDVLAYDERTTQGELRRQQVITDRHIVAALPERIVKVLGTKRVTKSVGYGG